MPAALMSGGGGCLGSQHSQQEKSDSLEAKSMAESPPQDSEKASAVLNAAGSVQRAAHDWLYKDRDSIFDQYDIPASQRLCDRIKADYFIPDKAGLVAPISNL
eukprot:4554028-Pyramimonas_sp.AAC.1